MPRDVDNSQSVQDEPIGSLGLLSLQLSFNDLVDSSHFDPESLCDIWWWSGAVDLLVVDGEPCDLALVWTLTGDLEGKPLHDSGLFFEILSKEFSSGIIVFAEVVEDSSGLKDISVVVVWVSDGWNPTIRVDGSEAWVFDAIFRGWVHEILVNEGVWDLEKIQKDQNLWRVWSLAVMAEDADRLEGSV